VRLDSAVRTAFSTSSGSERNSGRSTGVMVALERQFRGPHRRLGLRQRLTARGGLGLGLHDVERRHRAHLDARLVVLHEFVGEVERSLGDVHRLHREHQLPVRVAHVGDRRGQGALQLNVRDLAVDGGDLQLLPRAVDPEVAQQRLRERGAEVGVEGRVEVGERVGADLLVVVERHRDVAAAPRQELRQPGVVGGRVVLHESAAVQLAGRRLDAIEMADLRREGRTIGRVDPFEVGVLNHGVQALHGEIEVAFERTCGRVVERQLDVGARGRDRYRRPGLIGGGSGGLELTGGVAGEVGDSRLVAGGLSEHRRCHRQQGGGAREHAKADRHDVTALRVEEIRGRMAAAGDRGARAVAGHRPAPTSAPHYCVGAPARVRAPAPCAGLRT
jgi:hypothetical protein